MIARDHAGPAQHAHVAKRVAPTNRDRLGCTNRHLRPAVRQRIPDAVEHFLRNTQFDVGKMTIEIDDHLPGPLRLNNVIHRDSEMPAPAVGDLLALLTGDLHFFDDRPPFLQKPRSGRRELHVAMTPLEQRYRQPRFQLTHRVTDRRGNAMQLLGGAGKAAVTRHGINHFKGII